MREHVSGMGAHVCEILYVFCELLESVGAKVRISLPTHGQARETVRGEYNYGPPGPPASCAWHSNGWPMPARMHR